MPKIKKEETFDDEDLEEDEGFEEDFDDEEI